MGDQIPDKIKDLNLFFRFSADTVEVDSLIVCPECKEASRAILWNVAEFGCEICDTHMAMMCPNCKHNIDYTYQTQPLEVLNG